MGESRTGLATQIPARSWVWRKSSACGREHRSKICRTASSMARRYVGNIGEEFHEAQFASETNL